MAFFTYITTSKNKLGYFKQFNCQKKTTKDKRQNTEYKRKA